MKMRPERLQFGTTAENGWCALILLSSCGLMVNHDRRRSVVPAAYCPELRSRVFT
jgi:hypothetical protein